jgi:hypothetical protein
VFGQHLGQERWYRNETSGGGRLNISEVAGERCRFGDQQRSSQQVDPAHPQPSHLRPAQTQHTAYVDHRAVGGLHCIGQPGQLVGRQHPYLASRLGWELHPSARTDSQDVRRYRRVHHGAVGGVEGANGGRCKAVRDQLLDEAARVERRDGR